MSDKAISASPVSDKPGKKEYAKGRPSDMEILNVLADHFGTDRQTVCGWIEEIGREFVRMNGEAA